MSDKKYFPIKTATACPLKWSWSTLYLSTGITASCHRTAFSKLTPENFFEFHNTPTKLADRNKMLNGEWPDDSCKYCRNIEESGGTSDRLRQLSIPDLVPTELDTNLTATHISPTIMEVFFNNTCNLGCLYCYPSISSTINSENQKFGNFDVNGVQLYAEESQFKNLVPYFWEWFVTGFSNVKRLHILGGEPFYQKDFEKLLDMIDQYPNSRCEINIITNLMIDKSKLEYFINKMKSLVSAKKVRRFDITCSIDCWGPQQEHVRYGLDLVKWEKNFKYLLEQKWLVIHINQTISALTIKTMPELLINLKEWQKEHKIGHWFSGVSPGPTYMKADIFSKEEFQDDFDKILNLMSQHSDEDKLAYDYMKSIALQAANQATNQSEVLKLITFLNEKDRRRNTNWRELFPWLIKYEDLCGIQE